MRDLGKVHGLDKDSRSLREHERYPIRPIGIDLGDNDFSCTVRPFLQALVEDQNYARYNYSKAYIVWLFRRTAPALYWLRQVGDESYFVAGTYEKEDAHITKYLQIDPKRVYLDGEVLARYNDMMSTQNMNYSFWFCLDGKTVQCL